MNKFTVRKWVFLWLKITKIQQNYPKDSYTKVVDLDIWSNLHYILWLNKKVTTQFCLNSKSGAVSQNWLIYWPNLLNFILWGHHDISVIISLLYIIYFEEQKHLKCLYIFHWEKCITKLKKLLKHKSTKYSNLILHSVEWKFLLFLS